MDSIFGWLLMTAVVIGVGIWFARYAITEHEKYIYKRQHGWQ